MVGPYYISSMIKYLKISNSIISINNYLIGKNIIIFNKVIFELKGPGGMSNRMYLIKYIQYN